MITNTELNLWVNGCKAELELADCSPNIDMSPSSETIVRRFWLRTKLELTSKDFDEIVSTFHKWRIEQ